MNNIVLSPYSDCRQIQSRVLKGAIYTLDFCSVLRRSTSFLDAGLRSWGGTKKRVLVLLMGMEF